MQLLVSCWYSSCCWCASGTGKTDTAVQIMHVLYANNPGQRVLLITHSNQALNDLFSKLLER
jgi:intron-binding protein aquarius